MLTERAQGMAQLIFKDQGLSFLGLSRKQTQRVLTALAESNASGYLSGVTAMSASAVSLIPLTGL